MNIRALQVDIVGEKKGFPFGKRAWFCAACYGYKNECREHERMNFKDFSFRVSQIEISSPNQNAITLLTRFLAACDDYQWTP